MPFSSISSSPVPYQIIVGASDQIKAVITTCSYELIQQKNEFRKSLKLRNSFANCSVLRNVQRRERNLNLL